MMVCLCPETTTHGHLWEIDDGWEKRKRLMSIMDEVNGQFGRGTLEIAVVSAKADLAEAVYVPFYGSALIRLIL